MFPHRLTDTRAFEIARAMLDGFNRHYRLFRETSAEEVTAAHAAALAGIAARYAGSLATPC